MQVVVLFQLTDADIRCRLPPLVTLGVCWEQTQCAETSSMRLPMAAQTLSGSGCPEIAGAGVLAAFIGPGQTATRPRGLIATLNSSTGAEIGIVRFLPTDDGKVSVRVSASGLTPGFHGYHVHTAGVCGPGGHRRSRGPVAILHRRWAYNPDTTSTHGAHAGDMAPLLVTADGTAFLKFRTDRFTTAALMDSDRSAVILHAGPDNLATVPATTATGEERYHSHVDSVLGADTVTKATGDAGARFACGVIERYTS